MSVLYFRVWAIEIKLKHGDFLSLPDNVTHISPEVLKSRFCVCLPAKKYDAFLKVSLSAMQCHKHYFSGRSKGNGAVFQLVFLHNELFSSLSAEESARQKM